MKYIQLKETVTEVLCCVWLAFNTACVNKIESDSLQPGTVPISFSCKITKATTRVIGSIFEKGDQAGLFAMLTGSSLTNKRYINNLKLEYGEQATFLPEQDIFYPEGDVTLDFVSYYPYQATGISAESSSISVSVQTNQSTKENHSASDFLIATASQVKSSNKPVELEFHHKLARITLSLLPKEGENVEAMLNANPRITATGFGTQAKYDIATDQFEGMNEITDIIPYGKWTKSEDGTYLTGKEIIVIPQTISEENQSLIIEWNGKLYACPMPRLAMKESTQCEIKIDAKQSTSNSLTGIASKIVDWETIEGGSTETDKNMTSIHLSALSFTQSDLYKVYHEGSQMLEICKEYLCSKEIKSRAIVAYPTSEDGQADLSKGTVLQLLDVDEKVHGGKIQWNKVDNTFTYEQGTSKPIDNFYLDENSVICTDKPASPLSLNIVNHVIRDIRKGVSLNYPIVKIGVQYWMKENLRTTMYRNGTAIMLQTNLGHEAGYFKPSKQEIYFYNGEAILAGELAPEYWRIPKESDWELLKTYISNDASLLKTGKWQGLKEGDAVFPATNQTGFNAAPIGMWYAGQQSQTQKLVGFWSMDKTGKAIPDNILFLTGSNKELVASPSKVTGEKYYKGLSIRCIRAE